MSLRLNISFQWTTINIYVLIGKIFIRIHLFLLSYLHVTIVHFLFTVYELCNLLKQILHILHWLIDWKLKFARYWYREPRMLYDILRTYTSKVWTKIRCNSSDICGPKIVECLRIIGVRQCQRLKIHEI